MTALEKSFLSLAVDSYFGSNCFEILESLSVISHESIFCYLAYKSEKLAKLQNKYRKLIFISEKHWCLSRVTF